MHWPKQCSSALALWRIHLPSRWSVMCSSSAPLSVQLWLSASTQAQQIAALRAESASHASLAPSACKKGPYLVMNIWVCIDLEWLFDFLCLLNFNLSRHISNCDPMLDDDLIVLDLHTWYLLVLESLSDFHSLSLSHSLLPSRFSLVGCLFPLFVCLLWIHAFAVSASHYSKAIS